MGGGARLDVQDHGRCAEPAFPKECMPTRETCARRGVDDGDSRRCGWRSAAVRWSLADRQGQWGSAPGDGLSTRWLAPADGTGVARPKMIRWLSFIPACSLADARQSVR